VFEPGGSDEEQDQHDYQPLLGRREDKEVEKTLHFAA
jgi:hypothetical protein